MTRSARNRPREVWLARTSIHVATAGRSPVLRQHALGPDHRVATEAATIGAPMGPPLPGLASRPLDSRSAVECLPWAHRIP